MVSDHASPLACLGGADSGGQNVHVAALSSALAARGVQVTVYTRRDDPDLPARVQMCPGVAVEHLAAGPAEPVPKDDLLQYMGEFTYALHRKLSGERPDLVHAHFWMSGMAALGAARPLGIAVAQTFHALGVVKRRHQGCKDTSPPERLRVEASVVAGCDRVLATASDELFELLRLGAERCRIAVVPCGVDLQVFSPDGPSTPRRPGVRRIVTVSRLVERKGIGNVISALAAVPDCELLIGGGPSLEELERHPEVRRFRQLAEQAGVADRVAFLGRLDRGEVARLLRSADVAVCAPWYEPFGLVALEAMACGVPLVVSAVGGQVDTVVDGLTGVHVPPREPRELARALNALLADPLTRARMGNAGAARARARYSWPAVAGMTLREYRYLLEDQGRLAVGAEA